MPKVYHIVKEHSTDYLKKNLPEKNLPAGSIGVVLIVYNRSNLPQAYEVEFNDPQGRTITTTTLFEEDLEKAEAIS